MVALITLVIFFLAAVICYIAEHKAGILKSLGFGFLVYHSDSQKTFYAKNFTDALEWSACALGDVSIICNRTKTVQAIRFVM